ncbi:hypothetical protein ACVDG8_035105 [Mesorhizobium sp. ORM8.1]
MQIEFALMQRTQQLRSGRAMIDAGISHERTDDRRIQCRSLELVAGLQDTEEAAETAFRGNLHKGVAFTAVEIDLLHIRGRFGDRAIEEVTAAAAKLRQEEGRNMLEIFMGKRPNRAAVRVQYRPRRWLFWIGICRNKMQCGRGHISQGSPMCVGHPRLVRRDNTRIGFANNFPQLTS